MNISAELFIYAQMTGWFFLMLVVATGVIGLIEWAEKKKIKKREDEEVAWRLRTREKDNE